MAVISSLLVELGIDTSNIGAELGEGVSAVTGSVGKFAAAGALVAGGLVTGVVGAMNVEAANDKLAAQLGLSAKESQRIGGIAGDLYSNAYGDSLGQVNDAVGAVMSSIEGMATASSGRLEAVTAKALDFASAFEVDVTRAAQVAGQMVSTGLAKNATEAFDLITAASQRVPAALREDVLDAADEYGQFFASLGYDGEQAFAMLVQASEKGMYGIDKVGDAVKEFTIRSTDMSTASKDAYKMIGLNAREMADMVLAGGTDAQKATQQVVDGLLSIESPSKRANAAIALFGTPLEDLNASEIPQFLKQLQGSSKAMDGFKGSAADMGKTLNDNASTNLTAFKRQVTQTFIEVVGGRVIPIVNEVAAVLATGLGPAFSTVTGFLSEHQTVMQGVVVVLGAAGAALVAYRVGVVAAAASTQIAAVATTLWTAATKVAAAAQALMNSTVATFIGVKALEAAAWVRSTAAAVASTAAMVAHQAVMFTITAATKAWTIAQTALNVVMAMNPIALVVIAIAALVAGLVVAYNKSETFRNIVDAAFRAVGEAAEWLWEKIKWAAGLMVDLFMNFTLPGLIIKHWDTIKSATTTAWNAVVDFVKAIPGKVVSFFLNWTLPGLIIKHWDTIKSGTRQVWDAVVDFVKAIPGKLVSFFLNWTLPGLVIKHWQTLKDGTIEVATSIVEWVKGLPSRFISALSALGGMLRELAVAAWDKFRSAAADKVDAVLEMARGIGLRVKSAVGDLGGILLNAGRSIIQGLIDGIAGKLDDLRGMLSNVTGLIPDWKGPAARDRVLLEPAGRMIMNGLLVGIDSRLPALRSLLGNVTDAVAVGMPSTPTPALAGGAVAPARDTSAAERAERETADRTDEVLAALATLNSTLARMPRDYRIGDRQNSRR